jgi:hypothetical protein
MSSVTTNLKLLKHLVNESRADVETRNDANLDTVDAANKGAAGSNTQVQFNDSGVLGGNVAFSFAKATGILTLGGLTIATGTGSPEAALIAPVGSLFLRSDGGSATCLYVKETGTGNTGWIGK